MIEIMSGQQWGQDTLVLLPETAGDVAETDPGLFMFMMIFAVGTLVSAIVCCVLIMVAGMFLAGMAATGVVSVSILVGYSRRSVSAGWKTLWLLGGFSLGAIVATMLYGALCYFSTYIFSGWSYIMIVITAGIAGGLVAGWVGKRLLKMVIRRVIQKLRFS
jgi:hypothetical protein